jgi:uncharacterized membrane protein YadS
MNVIHSARLEDNQLRHASATTPGHFAKVAALVVIAIGLILWASLPTALVVGILFALLIGHPFAHWNHKVTKWLLQVCVVLLGFGMNLPVVLRPGLNGSLFAAATICATLLLGWWVGRRLALDRKTTTLISVGTAICGGSAIAAVSSVIAASEAEIAVPWFIGFFLLASLLRSYAPTISVWSPQLSEIARRGMILVLFLIGTSLSLRALRVVGWRTVVTGLALWLFISVASLQAIRSLNLIQ